MSETRATEAEMTRSYYDASDARTQRMIVECDHETALDYAADTIDQGDATFYRTAGAARRAYSGR